MSKKMTSSDKAKLVSDFMAKMTTAANNSTDNKIDTDGTKIILVTTSIFTDGIDAAVTFYEGDESKEESNEQENESQVCQDA